MLSSLSVRTGPQEALALLLLLPALALGGCAADVVARYPSEPGTPAGEVIVEASSPVSNLKVTLDGHLVVGGELTEHVVISGVPVGLHTLVIAGGDGFTEPLQVAYTVEVEPGGEHTILVAAPQVVDGAWIYMGLEYVGVAIMYAAWVLAFF